MLRIQIRHKVGSAVNYFRRDDGLAMDEKEGVWYGAGCSAAGVAPAAPVADAALTSLLLGHHAQTGNYLGLRRRTNRRACWDVVLAPHKSVSIARLSLGPEIGGKVKVAWQRTLQTFVGMLDGLAARQDSGGPFVRTGNVTAAVFTHHRSRHGDPHLHGHILVMNATHDDAAGWRSLEPHDIFKNHVVLEAAFNHELCRNLRRAGIDAVMDERGKCRVPTIGQAPCDRLSKAHFAIRAGASELPRPDELAKLPPKWWENYINDRTRPDKQKAADATPFDRVLPRSELAKLRVATRKRPPTPLRNVSPPEKETVRVITAAYRQKSLFRSPRAFLKAVAETLTNRVDWLLTPVLTAAAAMREPLRLSHVLPPSSSIQFRSLAAAMLRERGTAAVRSRRARRQAEAAQAARKRETERLRQLPARLLSERERLRKAALAQQQLRKKAAAKRQRARRANE